MHAAVYRIPPGTSSYHQPQTLSSKHQQQDQESRQIHTLVAKRWMPHHVYFIPLEPLLLEIVETKRLGSLLVDIYEVPILLPGTQEDVE